jgi:hypothetical protein
MLHLQPIASPGGSKQMRRAILAGAFVLAAFPATASPIPAIAINYGDALGKFCAADRQSGLYGMCFSFIAAVLEVLENNDSIYGYKVCIPQFTNVDQAVSLTTEWIKAHPDSGVKAASLVTTEALAAAFPCKNSN